MADQARIDAVFASPAGKLGISVQGKMLCRLVRVKQWLLQAEGVEIRI